MALTTNKQRIAQTYSYVLNIGARMFMSLSLVSILASMWPSKIQYLTCEKLFYDPKYVAFWPSFSVQILPDEVLYDLIY